MMEQAPCHVPGCERPANPEVRPLEVCIEHWDAMNAASEVEAWGLALGVLRPMLQTTRSIGFDKLSQVMRHALAEAELKADLARDELERAEAALL